MTVFETIKAQTAYDRAQEELRSMNLTKDETPDEYIPVVEAEFVEVVKEVKEDRE
ncbi:MAG: hypothetical protein II977_00840 [Oscillospiraceae bacterium]|nr:hypothetical protein [Oscillospiraceae bacterium]